MMGAEERRWRPSESSLPERLAAARARTRRRWRRGNYCPAAGRFCLKTFWFDDATGGSRQGYVDSNATDGGAAERRPRRTWRFVPHGAIARAQASAS